MARKSASAKPFIGDQILAVYQALGWCCCLGFLSAGTIASLAQAAKPSLLLQFEKQHPSESWKYLNEPKYMAPLGVALAVMALFIICWIVATWRGRAWALALHMILNGLGVAIGLVTGTLNVGSILAAGVAIYCVLRLTGSVGTAKKATPAPRRKPASTTRRHKKRK